jgi:hypothetical protein
MLKRVDVLYNDFYEIPLVHSLLFFWGKNCESQAQQTIWKQQNKKKETFEDTEGEFKLWSIMSYFPGWQSGWIWRQ